MQPGACGLRHAPHAASCAAEQLVGSAGIEAQRRLLPGSRRRPGGDGLAVHHFALLAEPATVRRRLGRRSLGTELKPGSWAVEHLSEHLQQLGAPEFAQHIHTDQQTVAQVADAIASAAGLAITPCTDGPLRASLRRYATTIRRRVQ